MALPPGVREVLLRGRRALPRDRYQRVVDAVENLFEATLTRLPDGTVFVSTGDIPAMWLRDSTWQMRPLLAVAEELETYRVIAAVVRRQTAYVRIDPYANAFNPEPSGDCWHQDFDDQSPWVFERKYELDSLTCFLDLAVRLHRASGRDAHLDADFWAAAHLAVEVIEREIHHDRASYRLHRPGTLPGDSLSHDGYGAPFEPTGMSWSGFRPSDDACHLPFLIPSNAHAVVVLEALSRVPARVRSRLALQRRAVRVARRIRAGIAAHGLVDVDGTRIYRYEVDGRGGELLADDANIPSLLSLPYLGWCRCDDPVYLATRQRILGPDNPWWFAGAHGHGVGSAHTPDRHAWPLAIAMSGLTAQDPVDLLTALDLLEATDAGTGAMHESFCVDDPSVSTRSWFSWADMTYVHAVLRSAGLSAAAD